MAVPFGLAGGLLEAGLEAGGLAAPAAARFLAPAVPSVALPGDLRHTRRKHD